MNKKILVTGGAGYVGSHTSKVLARKGYEPICFDNLSSGHKEFVKWGPLEEGNLHDTNLLVDVLNRYKPLAVIHFAASAYVGESITNPFKYYRNNVGGTLSLLEAMRKTNIKIIVFSSTCATYGRSSQALIDESHAQAPINPYGQSKLMIEKILCDLAVKNEISQISLRYFNAAGADPENEIGEWHDPETHLIPLAIKSALTGSCLEIFGTDFPTPDGTAIRDYIHVEDLASAHISAVEAMSNGIKSEFINLGTGIGYSVKNVINAIEEMNLKINFKKSEKREGDPASLVANVDKALKILNWRANYTDIKDIIFTAIKWHKSQEKYVI